ncbi:ABC transporter substrate-binding protein [Paenibacillus sp. FSL L8-0470]|uniref:ABC transporter substrate-binding protein n=1 Tax=unclassified Paenibacillus TaxID=185978 RepID=UPI0030F70B5F
MKHTKKLTIIVAGLLVVSLLSGCGKTSDSASNGGKENGGKEELRISWWGGDSRNKAVQEAISKFEEENPNIKVKAEFAGYAGYQEKMTTQLSGGTAPDVIRLDSMWVDQYENQLSDLKELGEELGLSNFSQNVLAPLEKDGKLLGLPLSTVYRPLLYNKTVTDKYGIEAPQSWDDLFAMRDKLPEDHYPMANLVGSKYASPIVFFSIFAQQTGLPLSDDNGNLNYKESDFENMLSFYRELVEKRIMPSKKEVDNSGSIEGATATEIMEGKWVSLFEFTSNTNTIQNQLKEQGFDLEVAGFLSMKDEKSTGVWTKPAMVYSIPEKTKHKESAAKLINFLMNSEEANKIQMLENGVPDSKAGKEVLEKNNLITPLTAEITKLGDEKNDSKLSTMFKWDTAKLNDVSLDVITKLDYGEVDTKEAAKELYAAYKEQEQSFKK